MPEKICPILLQGLLSNSKMPEEGIPRSKIEDSTRCIGKDCKWWKVKPEPPRFTFINDRNSHEIIGLKPPKLFGFEKGRSRTRKGYCKKLEEDRKNIRPEDFPHPGDDYFPVGTPFFDSYKCALVQKWECNIDPEVHGYCGLIGVKKQGA
jgi:hypothetical protein